jgi:hypothetical protein
MISYKTLTGGEVTYWHGNLLFWMSMGVYTLEAANMKRHGHYISQRYVVVKLYDKQTNHTRIITEEYPADFDDYEIIYRWISGTASCDCVRGEKLYGPTLDFECNRGPNRFIIKKLTIGGEPNNCVLTYKEFR